MSSTDGYVSDIGYTAEFYPETTPAHMAFAAFCAGRSPGRATRPARVLELGFGQGFGLALLAAANPTVAFEGCDFNREHVAHARELIDEAGIANLTVSQASFDEAAARGGANDVDVAVLHGVLSWISPIDQDAVVAILRKRLRPGGIAYVSYNCMPGWAPLAPIRHLMLEVKRRNPGSTESQLALALDLIAKLWQGAAGYFAVNPIAAQHASAMLGLDRLYLAHEYFAEHGEPPHHSDVAALLAQAELSYAASAALLDNFDKYAVPHALLPLIPQIGDPILCEEVRDFAANRRFRRDLFGRGIAELSGDEQRRVLSQLSFALAVPRARMMFKFLGPVSELTLKPEFHACVADLLAQKIASFDELLALPAFGENGAALLLDCLALLIHSGQVLPLIRRPDVDVRPAQRFNRAIVGRAAAGRLYGHLASPVAGTGIPIDEFGLLALAALFDGECGEPAAAARHGLLTLGKLGRRPMRDNLPIADDGEAILFLAEQMKPVIEDKFTVWRRLGVI